MTKFSKFTLILIVVSNLNIAYAQDKNETLIFQKEDVIITESILNEFSSKSNMPINELIVMIGKKFIGTDYEAATLENGKAEKLVINLRKLDCTTFAENCLALARTIKLGKTDFGSFASELEKIRYRDGIRAGYQSRLHYFTEWISDNKEKKIVDDEVNSNGKFLKKDIWFMSRNSDKYPVLKQNQDLVPIISKIENELSVKGYFYFPKADTINLLNNLQDGDIIGLTTNIQGIDMSHVGIIVSNSGKFQLMHASQSEMKVLISQGSITNFIKPDSKNTGIIIARPVY